MRILFLVPYPTEGASNRFRVEQYLPYLKEKGIDFEIRPFVSSKFYRILYLKRYFIKKIFFFILSSIARIFDIFKALRYDVIFIHRESYPLGPPFIERILKLFKKKIIFDFDDAIFLPASSGSNVFIERFNRYGKVPEVITLSDHVITGNNYLEDFALKYNENITVIPTPVDTERYVTARRKENNNEVIIGWIGSKTTSIFLEPMRDTFKFLLGKYPNLKIKVVGGEFDTKGIKRLENIVWSLEREIEVLQSFDIGIMPMSDSKWTRGKCAFKTILYMSVGIPCVSSPVGITVDIIENDVNGFLANSDSEWKEKLSILIESPDLRRKMGENARKTAIEKYSVRTNVPKFLGVLDSVRNR